MRLVALAAAATAYTGAFSLSRTLFNSVLSNLRDILPAQVNAIFRISDANTAIGSSTSKKMTGAHAGSCAHKHGEEHDADPFEDRDVLPDTVTPAHYELRIEPDMQKFTFAGVVRVEVNVHAATNVVHMNTKELSVSKALVFVDGAAHECTFSVDNEKEVLTLHVPTALAPATRAVVEVHFAGAMNDKMAGFYRSQYVDEATGATKWMGATQFESTDARQAFPCWDEPARKATFGVTLVVPKDLVALGNMDVERDDIDGAKRVVVFRRSPVMSTYLVAWVVGELDCVETQTKAGVAVRVWAPAGLAARQGRFALDVGTRTLDFFESYFGIAYPLPKMDMVAIPDFSAGAMENWGLVTYRTAALLFDEASSSLKTKQYVAYVVGHELAHQWFGNLVTMEWWSDLWLNEGFATWVGWRAAHELFPEWDIWTEFVVDDVQAGLRLDGLRSSHAIEVPVRDPAAISQIFDSISYSKGASVIRMLVAYLGEDVFVSGLREYLRTHAYANARTSDLWASLAAASGRPVPEIMAAWTRRVGYPVVSVASAAEGSALDLAQSRFLSSGNVSPGEDRVVWHVPLRPLFGGVSSPIDHAKMLSERTGTLALPVGATWAKLNAGTAGFYRVDYAPAALRAIADAIAARDPAITAADRVGLVSDAFAMSVAGRLPLTAALDLLASFKHETDYLVWGEIAAQLGSVLSVWWEEPADVRERLEGFVRGLFGPQAALLGFDPAPGDADKTKLLRALVLAMAGRAGDEAVVAEARTRLARFAAGEESALGPDVRGAAYGAVLRSGTMADYETVLGLYKTLKVADQRLTALGALGSCRDAAAVDAALRLTLDDKAVRPQDVIYVTRATGANPAGRRATWAFVQAHWPFFNSRYGLGGGISLLGRVVSTATQDFTTEADADGVEAFFKDRETASFSRALQQSLERIRLNAAWLSANRQSVAAWLKALPK